MASPVSKKQRNAAQLAADGFAAVVEKLGMADAVRYMQLYDQGEGDYTRDRPQWLDQLSHKEIAELMAQIKTKPPRRKSGRKATRQKRR